MAILTGTVIVDPLEVDVSQAWFSQLLGKLESTGLLSGLRGIRKSPNTRTLRRYTERIVFRFATAWQDNVFLCGHRLNDADSSLHSFNRRIDCTSEKLRNCRHLLLLLKQLGISESGVPLVYLPTLTLAVPK